MKKNGFSLVEVLVAMVVLSVGLLGIAGMMASTVRNNHSAYHRSQATWLAYDMLDRVRANRDAALAPANNFNIALGTANSAVTGIVGGEVNAWKNRLAAALPAGDGSVTVVPATRRVTVVVRWNDSRGTGGSDAQQFVVETQL